MCCYFWFGNKCDEVDGRHTSSATNNFTIVSATPPPSKMTTNIGAQAAEAVNEKLLERQKLEQEMYAHHQDLGTLIAQRNENEMVKTVRENI
jgi:phage/plasmid primase-like uncharacterized protein